MLSWAVIYTKQGQVNLNSTKAKLTLVKPTQPWSNLVNV